MSFRRRPSTSQARSFDARSSPGRARFSAMTPEPYSNIFITAAAPAPGARVSGAVWMVSVSL